MELRVMQHILTIFGGSGFVGRYIALRMARQGWRVRVAVRRPNDAMFVKPYGKVGQVAPILCNIRDDASVRSALDGATAAVNCVGILAETGKQKFDALHAEAAGRVGRFAQEAGFGKLVHISAIGADANSPSAYARSKAAGEAAVSEAFPDAVILRPSVIFGSEDQFFNRFAQMATRSPVLPLVGAGTKFQPVYVDDVAKAAEIALTEHVPSGVHELGGPDVMKFEALMQLMGDVIQRKRLIADIPFGIAELMGKTFDMLSSMSGGLFQGPLSADQVANLRHDNIVSEGSRGFAELGVEPTALEAVLPEYLWRYRPSGQYAAIKNSAQNLRDT